MRTQLIGERIGESITGLMFWSAVLFFGMGGRLWRKYFQRQGEPWRALVRTPIEKPKDLDQEMRGGVRVAGRERAGEEGWVSAEGIGPVA